MRHAANNRVDWTALRAVLAARAELPPPGAVGAARAERLLDERTRKLAATTRVTPATEVRVLMLRVGAERYALPLSAAREAIELGRPTALPGVGAAISGIVNWRGELVVVFDLATLVGAAASKPTRAIVLAARDRTFALAVDAVDAIEAIDTSALGPAENLSPRNAGLFKGVRADALPVFDETALVARLASELQTT